MKPAGDEVISLGGRIADAPSADLELGPLPIVATAPARR